MTSHHTPEARRTGIAAHVAGASIGAAVIAAGLALATPGAAFAATSATVKLTSDSLGSAVAYNGGAGNTNNLRIFREGAKIAVTDVVAITPGTGCVSVTSTKAHCNLTFAGRDVRRVFVQLGDLADTASVEGAFAGQVFGDAGNDTLRAGQGDVSGDSAITYSGGPDTDLVSYSRATSGVSVTLDDVGNDGRLGQSGPTGRDNVRDDVEHVAGSEFGDRLTGDEKPSHFLGLGGADTIDPGANVDRVFGAGGGDTLLLKDGFVDFADGGPGTDTATVDRFDSLTTIEITK